MNTQTEIPKTEEKYCNFGIKNSRRAWHVVSAQELKHKLLLLLLYYYNYYYKNKLKHKFSIRDIEIKKKNRIASGRITQIPKIHRFTTI